MATTPLSILFQDKHIIVVHKPTGLLVHRSPISQDTVFLLQTLRDQIGQRVYPVHRLDRATSGVMVFGLSADSASIIANQFEAHKVEKEYHALVRGWVDDSGVIDHPISDPEGNAIAQEAITHYRCLERVEVPFAVDRYPSARYSLVSVSPHTGRRHQIRKHFKHISHHLIGDTSHGNGKHNRFFREHYDIHRLMLTATRLAITHPASGEPMVFIADTEPEWPRVFKGFGWE